MTDLLGPDERRAALAALRATTAAEPLDVLVVGAGVVGSGAALDAAARGLRVGLVEQRDIASGTSSRSSRLAHGGLRYLEQREFALVHEALTERGLLLDRISPHLVRPVPFLFPVTRRGWERPYVGAGIALYDLLSRVGAYGGTMPRPKQLSRAAVAGIAPGLDADELVGAVRYHDAQTDDARHTVALARSAAARGAAVATGVEVVGLLREGERVVGASVRTDDGESFDVHADVVLGAVGVWTDRLRELLDPDAPRDVRQSKGVHLVVPREAFRSSSAVIARTASSVLFLLPWGEHWLVGTTDTDDVGPLDEPSVTGEDVAYLIDQANRWLARPLTVEDVVGVYAGLRPLLSAGDADDPTATLSREHAVVAPAPGLVYVAGGKWTTYRVMAADVVDAAVEALLARRPERAPVPECTTDQIPVVGADDFGAAWADRERTTRASGLDLVTVEHLLRRHGDRTADVLELVAAEPDLGRLLHPGASYLRAEVVLAASHEGARTLDDALTRRLRLTTEVRDAGSSVAADAAALTARVHGWDADEQRAAVESLAHSRRARVPTSVPAPRPTTVAPRRGLTARGLMARTRERMSGAGGHRE